MTAILQMTAEGNSVLQMMGSGWQSLHYRPRAPAILSPSLLHRPKEERHKLCWGKNGSDSAGQIQPCLPQGCVWRLSPLERCWNTWCCTDHWALSPVLHPCKDKLTWLLTHSPAHLLWKGMTAWGCIAGARGQMVREELCCCALRAMDSPPPSFLLLCSFLMCSNEHRHVSSLLGVDFGQPLGQEAAASHFTDCSPAAWTWTCREIPIPYSPLCPLFLKLSRFVSPISLARAMSSHWIFSLCSLQLLFHRISCL